MPAKRDPQTWPFLRGDLVPHQIDQADLRNDNAGDELTQVQSIILRYLGNLPAEGTVDLETMAEDISRHYPFQGEPKAFFQKAVDALKRGGWVKVDGSEIELHKIARVMRGFLLKARSR